MKRSASIKPVISHSKVFATSAALSFRAVFSELFFCLSREDINADPATKGALRSSFQKSLTKALKTSICAAKNLSGAHSANNLKISGANIETLIMPIKPYPVNITLRFEHHFANNRK